MENTKEKKRGGMPKAMRIISAVLCVILAIVLIGNLTIIIKGSIDPDTPPAIFGIRSMIVMSGSMSGTAPDHIEVGDLIVAKSVNPDELQVGDVITYMENGKTTVTHRIIGINEDGSFETKGDANDSVDTEPVQKDTVIGKFWFRIPKLGDLALFAQTPTGMLVCIGVPLAIYILLDVILRARQNKKDKKNEAEKNAENERLQKELEELKAKMAVGSETTEE